MHVFLTSYTLLVDLEELCKISAFKEIDFKFLHV